MNSWKMGFPHRFMIGGMAVFMAALVLFLPLSAGAHPPKEVKLVYEASTKSMKVTIVHSSPFPSVHYINKVEIKKNGQVVLTKGYKSQPAEPAFFYTYSLDAAAGDIVEVTATCNMYGAKTEKLTIAK